MQYIKLKTFTENAAADGRRAEFNFKNESVVAEGVNPDIVFIGDSITHMWELQAYFRSLNKFIINRGIGGDVSKFMLLRFEADALSLCPKKIVILIGINDINQAIGDTWWREKGRDTEEILTEYRENMRAAAALCRKAGIALIICSILPTDYGDAFVPGRIKDAVKEANVFLKGLADEYGFQYADYHGKMCAADKKTLREGLAQDGLHPNAKGYKIMADVLKPLLK